MEVQNNLPDNPTKSLVELEHILNQVYNPLLTNDSRIGETIKNEFLAGWIK
jgi:hypothetical protein